MSSGCEWNRLLSLWVGGRVGYAVLLLLVLSQLTAQPWYGHRHGVATVTP